MDHRSLCGRLSESYSHLHIGLQTVNAMFDLQT